MKTSISQNLQTKKAFRMSQETQQRNTMFTLKTLIKLGAQVKTTIEVQNEIKPW